MVAVVAEGDRIGVSIPNAKPARPLNQMTTTADYDAVVARAPSDKPFEDEGLEEERELREGEEYEIAEPFNPNSIRIRTYNLSVGSMLDMIHEGDTDLQPSFQRRLGIWTLEKKSRLVESLLLRIPIPVFYAAANEIDNWSVVDGIQRLSTLDGYVGNEYRLRGLEYLNTYEGQYFHELPRHFQRRIQQTQLVVNVIEHGTPEEVMFNIFLRINTGGTPLSAQEIRHAINPGPVREFLRDIAESAEFLEATARSVNQRRMADRELALRFIAFYLTPPRQYKKGNLDRFLGEAMVRLNGMTPRERANLAEVFRRAMRASQLLLGDEAFRKPRHERGYRRPVNRALFEAWSVNIALRTSEQIETLVCQADEVRAQFKELAKDPEFDASISWGTGSIERVHKRFDAINELIAAHMTC